MLWERLKSSRAALLYEREWQEVAGEAIRAVEEIVEDLLKSGKWYNINSEAFKDYLKRELLGDA